MTAPRLTPQREQEIRESLSDIEPRDLDSSDEAIASLLGELDALRSEAQASARTLEAVTKERERALQVLDTHSGDDLEDACRQVKQAAISNADNSDVAERLLNEAREDLSNLTTRLLREQERSCFLVWQETQEKLTALEAAHAAQGQALARVKAECEATLKRSLSIWSIGLANRIIAALAEPTTQETK